MTRVLVVDDELLVRVGVASCIDWEAHGFTIAGQASNGREAWEIVERTGVDIVLTDIIMPEMDGIELIEKLRLTHPDVRVVVLSCHDELAYVKKAMKLGAVDYILKLLLHPEDLLRVVREARSALPARAGSAEHAPAEPDALVAELLRRLPPTIDSSSFAKRLSSALGAQRTKSVCEVSVRLLSGEEGPRTLSSCISLAESVSSDTLRVVGARVGPRSIVLLFLSSGDRESPWTRIEKACADLHARVKALFAMDSEWMIGERLAGVGGMADSFMRALDVLAAEPDRRVRQEIERVADHVREHFAEKLSTRRAAEIACMSPNHFSTTFRKEMDESFVHFCNRIKMQKARQLMEEKGCLVYEAALAVGIDDIPYFSKLYKRIVGVSPREARTRQAQS